MICHHPHASTLTAYAAGGLSEGFSLVTAAHAEWCPVCRQGIQSAEQVGGIVLSHAPQAGLSESGFDDCMARIQADESQPDVDALPQGRPKLSPAKFGEIPSVIRSRLDGDWDTLSWKRLVGGIWHHSLECADANAGWLKLFRFAPGVALPKHDHCGQEMTLVLQGAYEDEAGQFGVGDCADLEPHDAHGPQVIGSEDCIALIATTGPIRFEQLKHRIGAYFIGI